MMNAVVLLAIVAVIVAQPPQGGQRCQVPGNLGYVCQCVATQAECATSTCIDFIPKPTNLVTGTDQCAGVSCTGAQFCCAYAGCSGLRGSAGFQNNPGTPGTGGHTAGTAGAVAGAGAAGLIAPAGLNGQRGTIGTTGTSGTTGAAGGGGDSGIYGLDGFNAGPGTAGTAGVLGTVGSAGSQGTAGTAGSTGIDGTGGTSGRVASSGTAGVTTAGTRGTAGVVGLTGTAGSIGTAGVGLGTRGTVATAGGWLPYATGGTYGTAGTQGSEGTIGMTSGSAGTFGSRGAVISGTNGRSGTAGASGTAGTPGTAGVAAVAGASGTAGFSGFNGLDGIRGGVCQGAQALQIRSALERVLIGTSFGVDIVVAQPGFAQPTSAVKVKLNFDALFVASTATTFSANVAPAGVVTCVGEIRTFVCTVPVGVSSFRFVATSGATAGLAKIAANVFNSVDRDCNFAVETVRIEPLPSVLDPHVSQSRFECGCESASGTIRFKSSGCTVEKCGGAKRRRDVDADSELVQSLAKRAARVAGQRITGYVSVTYRRTKTASSSDTTTDDDVDRCGPHVTLLADNKPIWEYSQTLYGSAGVISGAVEFEVPLEKSINYVVATQTPHCAEYAIAVDGATFSFRPTSASTILVDSDAPLASLRGLAI